MTANAIRVGDRLRLKRDNPYGWTRLDVTVTEIRPRDGYRVPWIVAQGDPAECGDRPSYFRPSDFSGHA